jgi:hypothetical protein
MFTGALLRFLNRGSVKTLPGVHAKIYICDDCAIVTSANLTETAFTKRREIAILLEGSKAVDTIRLFKTWWETQAQELPPESITQLDTEKPSDFSPENEGTNLPILWSLPPKPDDSLFPASDGPERGFASYQRFLKHYAEFAATYAGVQQLWKEAPLFLETDAFLILSLSRSGWNTFARILCQTRTSQAQRNRTTGRGREMGAAL